MKRISFLVLVVCGVSIPSTHAQNYIPDIPFVSPYRYSTYAFGHDSTGLVPDSVHYSPYAFGAHTSGLIPDTVRYSPYVFNAKHNGLISEYGATYIPTGVWNGFSGRYEDRQLDRLAQSIDKLAESCKHTKRRSFNIAPPAHFPSAKHIRSTKGTDPTRIVKAYLDRVIPGQYKLQHSLCIDLETVSFDIVIPDMNLVIKYWNPAKFKALQQASNYKTQILSNYMRSWARIGNAYEAAGNTVVHITPGNNQQVIAKLTESLETEKT